MKFSCDAALSRIPAPHLLNSSLLALAFVMSREQNVASLKIENCLGAVHYARNGALFHRASLRR